MTTKNKAEELCYKITLELPAKNGYLYAKQCALITVDEVIKSIRWSSDFNNEQKKYWQEVKKEIELM